MKLDATLTAATWFTLHTTAALAVARDDESPITIRTNTPIQSRGNAVIPVVVGGPQDTFIPNLVRAKVGDIVQFQFSNGNHTVTQSDEKEGCQPMQAKKADAVHSGHIPFQKGQTNVGTFNMVVSSADPMFLYCATGPHCQEGQVMVINPANDEQLVKYAKLSMATNSSLDGENVSGGVVSSISVENAAFIPAKEET